MTEDPRTPRPGDAPADPPLTSPVVPGDETLVDPPAARVVREQVVIPPDAGVTPGVVHEEERLRVRDDGSVVREYDRVEQPPVDERRNWWPWAISGLLLLILIGLGIWYFTRDDKKTVAPVVGQSVNKAVTTLHSQGFTTVISRRTSGTRAGIVLGELPAAGTHASKGATVKLTVSSGLGAIAVPNAVGVSQGDARDRLVAAGFTVKSASVYSDQPTGTVVAQDPAAGQKVAHGTSVRINVSKGSATVDVPSEVGQTTAQAQQDLAAKGFKPSIVQVPSTEPADTVVAQNPSGGQARKGSSVRLNVSKGPAAATTATTTTETTATVPTTPATTSSTPTTTDGSTTTTPSP